ncbi:MAG: ParB N-terminal domain-containing protein [Acidobacteria bacterium]|nr:ParB N-terminal domain-containing protein [Acidobacteriota bacterium]
MSERPIQNIWDVPIEEINASDRTFSIRPDWADNRELITSIRDVGILNPLCLENTSTSKRVVRGFRRFAAARHLGFRSLPCMWLPCGDELQLFTGALWENVIGGRLSELEKALAIFKLLKYFKVSEEEALNRFLPMLDVRPDRFHLQRCLTAAQLPEDLQRALYGFLELEMALSLSRWNAADRAFFNAVVQRYQLGKNKQKELFTLLDELMALKEPGSGVLREAFWQESGAAEVDRDERLSPSDRYVRVIKKLRCMRYPNLSNSEERLHDLRAELKIPPEIQFNTPPFFEGNRIALSCSFKSPGELRGIAEKLAEIAESQELKEILEMF